MGVATSSEALAADIETAPVSVVAQVRTFLWLASGMFSTSSLALAFLDYMTVSAEGQAATHFLAAVVAAVLFGVATVLKLGPSEA
jgi:formate/nitrite transporter FocA (FNT family)